MITRGREWHMHAVARNIPLIFREHHRKWWRFFNLDFSKIAVLALVTHRGLADFGYSVVSRFNFDISVWDQHVYVCVYAYQCELPCAPGFHEIWFRMSGGKWNFLMNVKSEIWYLLGKGSAAVLWSICLLSRGMQSASAHEQRASVTRLSGRLNLVFPYTIVEYYINSAILVSIVFGSKVTYI